MSRRGNRPEGRSASTCETGGCNEPAWSRRLCANHVLVEFMRSVASYRGFLALLRPLRPTRDGGELGHEHYMLVENALHASILRKFISGDDVSLRNTLGALEHRAGQRLDDQERTRLVELMNGFSHEHASIVESYLYSEILHTRPDNVPPFDTYPDGERRRFPASLVSWIDEVSNRVVLLERLVDKVAGRRDWGDKYRAQTPADPTYAGATILAAAHDPHSSDYRYAQEYVRERDERYFVALDTVQRGNPVRGRPKVDVEELDRVFGLLRTTPSAPPTGEHDVL